MSTDLAKIFIGPTKKEIHARALTEFRESWSKVGAEADTVPPDLHAQLEISFKYGYQEGWLASRTELLERLHAGDFRIETP